MSLYYTQSPATCVCKITVQREQHQVHCQRHTSCSCLPRLFISQPMQHTWLIICRIDLSLLLFGFITWQAKEVGWGGQNVKWRQTYRVGSGQIQPPNSTTGILWKMKNIDFVQCKRSCPNTVEEQICKVKSYAERRCAEEQQPRNSLGNENIFSPRLCRNKNKDFDSRKTSKRFSPNCTWVRKESL